jgi:hypothetical protein
VTNYKEQTEIYLGFSIYNHTSISFKSLSTLFKCITESLLKYQLCNHNSLKSQLSTINHGTDTALWFKSCSYLVNESLYTQGLSSTQPNYLWCSALTFITKSQFIIYKYKLYTTLNNIFCSSLNFSIGSTEEKLISLDTARHFSTFLGTLASCSTSGTDLGKFASM